MRYIRPLGYTVIGFLLAIVVAPSGGGAIMVFAVGFSAGFIFGLTDD